MHNWFQTKSNTHLKSGSNTRNIGIERINSVDIRIQFVHPILESFNPIVNIREESILIVEPVQFLLQKE